MWSLSASLPWTITSGPLASMSGLAGQRLEVTLVNQGSYPHNVELELPTGEIEFERTVPPGQSGTFTSPSPDRPGECVYYCPVANHHDRGMESTLIVQR